MPRTLLPCPASPNCVCSLDERPSRRVEPLPLTRTPAKAIAAVAMAVRSRPGVWIVEKTDDYLHAVFVSPLFRFRDDVEFAADPEAGVIHIRSASRTGWWDFGVNRRRVRRLSEALRARV